MRALCQLGRSEDALRLYESVVRKVRAEYEEEPSLELVECAARARMF